MSSVHPDPRRLVPLVSDDASGLVPSAPGDLYFDYCLEPYRPRRPTHDKVACENLLWHSLRVTGVGEALAPPLRALQASVGRHRTVWGVKYDGQRIFWELYFYDPRRQLPRSRVGALAQALAPWLELVPQVPATLPYMMASFDLDETTAGRGRIESLNLYFTGEEAHAGRSYKVQSGGIELENTYRFFEAKRDAASIVTLLKSSPFVDYSRPSVLSKVLIPELFACKKICVSSKRACDAIYYSGINVEQLLWFMRRFAYPEALTGFVERHQQRLEHLYFDVGLDYRMDPSGVVNYGKTSYYGTF